MCVAVGVRVIEFLKTESLTISNFYLDSREKKKTIFFVFFFFFLHNYYGFFSREIVILLAGCTLGREQIWRTRNMTFLLIHRHFFSRNNYSQIIHYTMITSIVSRERIPRRLTVVTHWLTRLTTNCRKINNNALRRIKRFSSKSLRFLWAIVYKRVYIRSYDDYSWKIIEYF